MIAPEEVRQFIDILGQSQTCLVVLGNEPSVDHVATAMTLYKALRAVGKDVLLVAPQLPTVPQGVFADLNQIQTELGNRNLTVSFAYDEHAVDKVSYHIGEETGRFFLTIKPQQGHKPLSADAVEFSYTGAEADCVILVGVSRFEQLGSLYIGYEQFFADTTLVTVNSYAPEFGQLNLNTSGKPSMSETILPILAELQFTIDGDVATMLLYAIEFVTRGFQSLAVTAETFEVVAQLLRSGARRIRHDEVSGSKPSAGLPELDEAVVKASSAAPQKRNGKTNQKKVSVEPGALSYQPGSGVAKS